MKEDHDYKLKGYIEEVCPEDEENCEYGFSTCKYCINRFGIERCNPWFYYIRDKIHDLEINKRKEVNINFDYKKELDKRLNK